MDIIHPNVPETIKRLADAYEYLVERGGASIAYSLLPTSGKMQQRSSALSVAAGRGTHMVNEDDDTDAIVIMGETGATIQRVLG